MTTDGRTIEAAEAAICNGMQALWKNNHGMQPMPDELYQPMAALVWLVCHWIRQQERANQLKEIELGL